MTRHLDHDHYNAAMTLTMTAQPGTREHSLGRWWCMAMWRDMYGSEVFVTVN